MPVMPDRAVFVSSAALLQCYRGNNSWQIIQVDSFLRDNNFRQYMVHRFKIMQDIFIHLELVHTAWKVIFKNP